MRHSWLIALPFLTVAACSRGNTPPPTPESSADKAAASAPAGVGSQRQGPPPTSTPGAPAPAPTASDQQTGQPGQTTSSRSGGDQQGVTGAPPPR